MEDTALGLVELPRVDGRHQTVERGRRPIDRAAPGEESGERDADDASAREAEGGDARNGGGAGEPIGPRRGRILHDRKGLAHLVKGP